MLCVPKKDIKTNKQASNKQATSKQQALVNFSFPLVPIKHKENMYVQKAVGPYSSLQAP